MDRVLVHDSTFGSGPQAMAAGLATLSVIEDEGAGRERRAGPATLLRGGSQELVDRYELLARRARPRPDDRHRVRQADSR